MAAPPRSSEVVGYRICGLRVPAVEFLCLQWHRDGLFIERTEMRGHGVAICLVLGFAPAVIQAENQAVVVGVNEYDDKSFPRLRWSSADARAVGQSLSAAGWEVCVVTTDARGADSPKAPTKAAILHHIQQAAARCQKGDAILVYYSGTGFQPAGKDHYLYPMDAKGTELSTLIATRELLDAADSAPGVVRLVVIDACRNDPSPLRESVQPHVVKLPDDTAILTACARGEVCHESEKLQHGVFTHCLVEGLRGKAASEDRSVSFVRLAEHCMYHVPPLVRAEFNAQQTPHLRCSLSGPCPHWPTGSWPVSEQHAIRRRSD